MCLDDNKFVFQRELSWGIVISYNSVASGEGFFWTSVVLGIAALITILICWKWSVERVRLADKDKSEVKKSSNTKAVILDCFKDKALLSSFGFQIFMYAAIQIFFAFNQYMFLDYFQSTALSRLASVVMFFGMILTAPITVPLAKKFGKKEVSIVGLAISVVSYIVIFVTRVTSPYVYLVLIFFAFFGIGIMSMVSYAMTNDCVDNHYLETEDRVEGTVYAMASFVRKMAGVVCTGIGGWALTRIGYNELAVTQTEEVRQALFNIIVGLPLICSQNGCVKIIRRPNWSDLVPLKMSMTLQRAEWQLCCLEPRIL